MRRPEPITELVYVNVTLVTREGIPSGLPRGFLITLRHALYSDREFGGKKKSEVQLATLKNTSVLWFRGVPNPHHQVL